MSNAVFPKYPGLEWGVKRGESYDNITYPSANKYDTRVAKIQDPMFSFKLSYSVLRDTVALGELDSIRAFFNLRKGDFDSFLLYLPDVTQKASDGSVTDQALTLVGPNLYYAPMVHSFGSPAYSEVIYEIKTLTNVKANGSTLAAGFYDLVGPSGSSVYDGQSLPGSVLWFHTNDVAKNPLTPTAPITATFSWYYRVKFAKGMAEYEAFMYQLYDLQEIELVTSRG